MGHSLRLTPANFSTHTHPRETTQQKTTENKKERLRKIRASPSPSRSFGVGDEGLVLLAGRRLCGLQFRGLEAEGAWRSGSVPAAPRGAARGEGEMFGDGFPDGLPGKPQRKAEVPNGKQQKLRVYQLYQYTL